MNPRQIYILSVLLITVASQSYAASALPYGARVTAKMISPSIYSFTLYNTSTSDYWLRDVSFETCPTDASVPINWEAYWNGKGGYYWMNSSPNGEPVPNSLVTCLDLGIAPGQSQNGIDFDYTYQTGDFYVSCIWWGSFYGPTGYAECSGVVEIADNVVPEPSTLTCLGMAVSLLGYFLVFRNLRRAFR